MDNTLIDEVIALIVKEVSPEQIILFGSYAKGMVSERSDIDILVVESDDFGVHKSRRKELLILSKAIARFQVPIDLLLYSKREVAFWKNSLNHVVGRVFREGKVLYERH